MIDIINQTHSIALPGINFERTGLSIPHGLAFERWEMLVEELLAVEQGQRWWLGDALNYGESIYGEKYAQAIDLSGLSYDTLADYCYVARNVARATRRECLSWSHHKVVAGLPVAEQTIWLQRAEDEGLTTRELREQVNTAAIPRSQPAPRRANAQVETQYDLTQPTLDNEPEGWDAITPLGRKATTFQYEAYSLLGAYTGYGELSEMYTRPMWGSVYVDIYPTDEPQALGMLLAAWHAREIGAAIIVIHSRLTTSYALPLWQEGVICLMEGKAVAYLGPDRAQFARLFAEKGVVAQRVT
jgi:hypothetical protein